MRVTNEMMVTASLRRLSTRLERYESTQARLGSGQQMLAPSDNPSGASRALGLRATQRAREQEQRNGQEALNWLANSDGQLLSGVNRLQRARDLAVRGAGSVAADERAALAAELRSVRDELVSIANTRVGGRPVFSGFSDADPVRFDGASWVYQGDSGQTQRRVGEQDVVTINVTAGDAFGFDAEAADGTGATRNTLRILDDLIAQMDAGDETGIRASIGALDGARERLTDVLGRIGSTMNWVQSAMERSDASLTALRLELAEVEDVNIAEAIMELQTQEVAYEATLGALGRALPASLISFLR